MSMQSKIVIATQQHSQYTYNHPTSMTWKIEKEAIVVLGSMRAILMQLAHPLIAAGSAMHKMAQNPINR